MAKGELSIEVRGLPEGIKFKDLSEMGEAALNKIIDHFDRIEFVKKDILDERCLSGGMIGERGADVASGENNEGRQNAITQAGITEDENDAEVRITENDALMVGEENNADVLEGVKITKEVNESAEEFGGNGNADPSEDIAGGVNLQSDFGEAGEGISVGGAGVVTEENGSTQSKNKRKVKASKEKMTKKKKSTYEKSSAFLCQEPPVDECTGQLNWVQCDSCNNWYHWDCVGMLRKPTGNFFCGCDKIFYSDRYKNAQFSCTKSRITIQD